MCAGPWLPILLKSYDAAFEEVHASTTVSSQLESSLRLDISLKGNVNTAHAVRAVLRDAAGSVVSETVQELQDAKNTKGVVQWKFGKDGVNLWWPVGYGTQHLYTLETTLLDKVSPWVCSRMQEAHYLLAQNQHVLDVDTQRIGFRRLQLIQEPLADAPGTTFLFEVNNVRMFMGGMFLLRFSSILCLQHNRFKLDPCRQLPATDNGRRLSQMARASSRGKPKHGPRVGWRYLRAQRILRYL